MNRNVAVTQLRFPPPETQSRWRRGAAGLRTTAARIDVSALIRWNAIMGFVSSLRQALLALAVSGVWLFAAPGAAPLEARRSRLGELPITLYPEFVVQDSRLPEFVNGRARAEDTVVVSWRDALKGSFRVSQLRIRTAQVWIYIPRDLDLVQQGWRNMQGISGIVYVPPAGTMTTAAMVNGVAETAAVLKCTLVVGVESLRTIPLSDVATLTKPAQVLTIYDNARLRGAPGSYREYVDRMIAEARGVNPAIKIEVAVATARGEQATKAVYETLLACSEVADRIGIFCNDTNDSDESLRLLFDLLRGRTWREAASEAREKSD